MKCDHISHKTMSPISSNLHQSYQIWSNLLMYPPSAHGFFLRSPSFTSRPYCLRVIPGIYWTSTRRAWSVPFCRASSAGCGTGCGGYTSPPTTGPYIGRSCSGWRRHGYPRVGSGVYWCGGNGTKYIWKYDGPLVRIGQILYSFIVWRCLENGEFGDQNIS